MRHYILGNGPSLTNDRLLTLDGPAWGVNRIWKKWKDDSTFSWRPDFYVRCEVPEYNEGDVREDLVQIADSGCVCYIQEGFKGWTEWGSVRSKLSKYSRFEYFQTCFGDEAHDWHLPDVCGFGTVVHVAMQLAILRGATELVMVGCDRGTPAHFYGDEGVPFDDLIARGDEIALRCSPVPLIWT